MDIPVARPNAYWWTNMGVFALLSAGLALTVGVIVPLAWYAWVPVVFVSVVISHLLVERIVSRYTNRGVGAILCRRDATKVAKRLSKVLTEYQSKPKRFREQLVAEVEGCDDANRVYAYLVRWADRTDWPAWAAQSLPSCYIPLSATRTGRTKAFAWHYLFELLEAMKAATKVRTLCEGKYVEADLTAEGADFVRRIAAPAFDSCASVGSSDRARVATALHAVREIELRLEQENPEQVELVEETHKAWLRREGVSLAS